MRAHLRTLVPLMLAFFACATVASTAGAQTTSPPTLTVAVMQKAARVSWAFTSDAKPKHRVVEIERQVANGPFSAVLTRRNAPLKGTYVDRSPAHATARYRARVVDPVTGAATPWSTPGSPPAPDLPPLAPGQRECGAEVEAEAIRLVNVARAAHGRSPLVAHPQLMAAARDRTSRLGEAGRLDNHAGTQAALRRAGFTGAAGENLATSISDAAIAIDGWMSTSSHRATILNSSGGIGMSCIVGGGWAWWTMHAEFR